MKHIRDGTYDLGIIAAFYGVSRELVRVMTSRAEFAKYRVSRTDRKIMGLIINTESRSNLEFWIEKSLKRKQERLKRHEEQNKGC